MIFHNNFINNTQQAVTDGSSNTWDDGYPSGGNYWSDYTDVDQKSGPNQDLPGNDGIWDHPYIIDANNQDNYPLTKPWNPKPPVPIKALEELIQTIESWNMVIGIKNSFTSKLQAAHRSLNMENCNAAIGQLTAFVNEVKALRGKKLTNEQVDQLMSKARGIISLIKGINP